MVYLSLQPAYVDLHLVARDPFRSLDIHGVGGMIQMAVRRCRRANKHIKVCYYSCLCCIVCTVVLGCTTTHTAYHRLKLSCV